MARVKDVIGGDTFKATWISSGDTFSPIYNRILDSSETLVNSATMTSSGNGHYYYNYTTITSHGNYVSESVGYINSLAYIRREYFRIVPMEVD